MPAKTVPQRIEDPISPLRHQWVVREALLRRLSEARDSIVVVIAPAGYGKSTLLGQWAERAGRVAFLRIDPTHDDPGILLSDMVAALQPHMAMPDRLRGAILAPGTASHLAGNARLIDAIARHRESFTMLFDDVRFLKALPSQDCLAWLMDRFPKQHRLVVASRTEDIPGLPRARSRGGVLEIHAEDLALDVTETLALATMLGMAMTRDEAFRLHRRTDGWPVATYLAIRAMLTHHHTGLDARELSSGRAEQHDYMRAELLDPLDADAQRWLLRCNVLSELSGPLCDHALETSGSLHRLRRLERTNHLVVPVDDQRRSYRIHHLFAEFLRDELEVREPDAHRRIAARAARWLETRGSIPHAVRQARHSGDEDLLAAMVARHALTMHQRGQLATVDMWLGWLRETDALARHPETAVVGAWCHALYGRTRAALDSLTLAQHSAVDGPMPDGTPSKGPWIAALRAMMMPFGMDAFLADEREARAGIAPASGWAVTVDMLSVIRTLVAGSADEIESVAAAAIERMRARGAIPGTTLVVGIRAAAAFERGDVELALAQVRRGLDLIHEHYLQEYPTSSVVEAVGARVAAAAGRFDDARARLAALSRVRTALMTSLPWAGILARVNAVRACVALRDTATARVLLAEIAEIRGVRPDLGALNEEVDRLKPIVDAISDSGSGPLSLTNAEVRLLAYLPTHLTFREIAERMYLSPHTVKTQAMSIYGKLGVSSRRAALEQAVAAGLLDPSVLRFELMSGCVETAPRSRTA